MIGSGITAMLEVAPLEKKLEVCNEIITILETKGVKNDYND